MKFGLISCALLLAYTIGSILQYRNVDLSQMELGRTLLGNNATHHPILVPMIVLHDVVSLVMTLLLVHQFVRSPFLNKEAHKSVGMVCFADIFPLEVLSGFIVMFCRIWTQPSSKGHQDLNMEEYVILMPWFGLFNIFAVLNAMFCIKPSWRKYTSLMIVVHVLGLLYGIGVMARHLVGNIMSLEAYSAPCALGTEHRVLDPAVLGHHLRRHQFAAVHWPLGRGRLVEADGLCACASDQYAVADGSRRGWNMVYRLYSPPLSVGTHADHEDVGAVGRFFRLSVRHGIRRRVDHTIAQSLL
ncbi:unnamed protein product [Symbiodinium sp. CCMP2592]|nr:unnamed protein product [Symbiodinium sp. CCMP2592]